MDGNLPTTYNPEDFNESSAEKRVDFLLLKNSKEDILDTTGVGYGPSTKLFSQIDSNSSCQIYSSEREKPGHILPSYFHNNTRNNNCPSEKCDDIPKAHIQRMLNEASEKVPRALRSAPLKEFVSSPIVKHIKKSGKESEYNRNAKYFNSIVSALKRYRTFKIKYTKKKSLLLYHQQKLDMDEDNPIADVMSESKSRLSEDSFCNETIPLVINMLTNREFIHNKTYLLYYTFHYVYTFGCSLGFPPVDFSLHPNEKIVLSALSEVDQMKIPRFKDLMRSAAKNIYYLIVRKPALKQTGVFALCRVFVEICKQKNLVEKPVSLAIDLLKRRNGYATILIAFMVSIWSVPFEVTKAISDEEKCLCSAIAFGVSKWNFMQNRMRPKPSINSYMSIKPALEIFGRHLCPVPDEQVIKEVIEFLFVKIHLECERGSPLDVDNILFAPIVIFASGSDWSWVQENILEKHVIPSLHRYQLEKNERAFAVFCDLYGEIFSYSSLSRAESLLNSYSKDGTVSEGNIFVKKFAMLSLVRLKVFRHKQVECRLFDWIEENEPHSDSLLHFLEKNVIKVYDAFGRVIKEDFLL